MINGLTFTIALYHLVSDQQNRCQQFSIFPKDALICSWTTDHWAADKQNLYLNCKNEWFVSPHRREDHSVEPSPAQSCVTTPLKTEAKYVRCFHATLFFFPHDVATSFVDRDSSFLSRSTQAASSVSPSPDSEVNRLFKKSVKRQPRPTGLLGTTFFIIQPSESNVCMQLN